MLILFQKGLYWIAAYSKPPVDENAPSTGSPDLYWTGKAWDRDPKNAKTFDRMQDATTEMLRIEPQPPSPDDDLEDDPLATAV